VNAPWLEHRTFDASVPRGEALYLAFDHKVKCDVSYSYIWMHICSDGTFGVIAFFFFL
jgi:hypothetical protein